MIDSWPGHESRTKLLVNGAVEAAQDIGPKPMTECNHRIRQLREHRSAHRSPGHCARKREVVIIVAVEIRLARGEAMDQYIMCRLDMKRLLDLSVGRDEEMNQNQSW